jgi:hypothetical protein
MATGAERMKRMKDRHRAGLLFMRILIDGEITATLQHLGWIEPGAKPAAIRDGLLGLLNHSYANDQWPTAPLASPRKAA